MSRSCPRLWAMRDCGVVCRPAGDRGYGWLVEHGFATVRRLTTPDGYRYAYQLTQIGRLFADKEADARSNPTCTP